MGQGPGRGAKGQGPPCPGLPVAAGKDHGHKGQRGAWDKGTKRKEKRERKEERGKKGGEEGGAPRKRHFRSHRAHLAKGAAPPRRRPS
jgi:Ni/Co efflux regulator RcnB